MGDGTEQNPLTRQDVLKLIEETGGKAEGLDLSGKTLTDGIDLSQLDLAGIILKNTQCLPYFWVRKMLGIYLEEDVLSNVDPEEVRSSGAHLEKARLLYAHLEGADLAFAHLEEADLGRAHLEGANLFYANLEGAFLGDTHLEGARLSGAHLEGAVLGLAHLEGASLGGAKFSADTKLDNVDWGNYVLGEEKNGAFVLASETYRRLKLWYTNAGMYDTAGEFFFREMTARRKDFWWGDIPRHPQMADLANPVKLKKFPKALSPKQPLRWAWSKLISIMCGYGERPLRVITWAALVILGLALIYFAIGTLEPATFLNCLYYSSVSFTALGYGSWLKEAIGWVKGLGAFESFIGVFSMALFLITFVRKMTR